MNHNTSFAAIIDGMFFPSRPYLGTVRGREEEATKLRLEMARSAVKYAEMEYDERNNEASAAFEKWSKLRNQRNEQRVYLASLRRDLQDLEASILPGAPK